MWIKSHTTLSLTQHSQHNTHTHNTHTPNLLNVEGLRYLLQTVRSGDLWQRIDLDGGTIEKNNPGQKRVLCHVVSMAPFEETRHFSNPTNQSREREWVSARGQIEGQRERERGRVRHSRWQPREQVRDGERRELDSEGDWVSVWSSLGSL